MQTEQGKEENKQSKPESLEAKQSKTRQAKQINTTTGPNRGPNRGAMPPQSEAVQPNILKEIDAQREAVCECRIEERSS